MNNSKSVFHQFVGEMDSVLRQNESVDLRTQEHMLCDLFKLELLFKKTLLSTSHGRIVYKQFMDYILKERRNILTTRVFFRERQATFSTKIAIAFHRRNSRMLHKFRINYLFARWAIQHYKGPNKRKLSGLLRRIANHRTRLCENNLPLAINRAKIFWSKVPASHLEYMDLIQTSSEGLINAIDKFVPPYKTVFRSVAIGRMTLNMITDNNATLLKFSPKEKRILYRANNAKNKARLSKDDDVVSYVSESFGGVTNKSLRRLTTAASSAASIDEKKEDSLSLSDKLPGICNTEDAIIASDLRQKLYLLVDKLPLLERKVVRLKHSI